MAKALSRRVIAQYVAGQLLADGNQHDLAEQLAAYLIESRRTKELNVIMRDIQFQLSQQGYVTGTVTSAFALVDSTKAAIEAYAKKHTGAAHIQLDEKVDERVLGGVRIDLPGYELNATVAHHLLRLKTEYKKA